MSWQPPNQRNVDTQNKCRDRGSWRIELRHRFADFDDFPRQKIRPAAAIPRSLSSPVWRRSRGTRPFPSCRSDSSEFDNRPSSTRSPHSRGEQLGAGHIEGWRDDEIADETGASIGEHTNQQNHSQFRHRSGDSKRERTTRPANRSRAVDRGRWLKVLVGGSAAQ